MTRAFDESAESAVAELRAEFEDRISTLMARSARLPTGTQLSTAATIPPPGTLLLQGQTVSRATYPDLWRWASTHGAVYAGGFGAGDGSTTFVLPDARNRVLVGAGGTYAVGATGGADTRVIAIANLPAHDHNVGGSTGSDSHSHSGTTGGSGGNHGNHNTDYFNASAGGVSLYTASSPFGNAAHEHGFTTGSDAHTHTLSITEDSVGSGTALDVRQPYLATNVLIYT